MVPRVSAEAIVCGIRRKKPVLPLGHPKLYCRPKADFVSSGQYRFPPLLLRIHGPYFPFNARSLTVSTQLCADK